MDLKVEMWPVERLVPYARNPRKNDEQVEKMAASIREFGFRIPVVAKSDAFILTGTYAQQWERLGRMVPPVMMSRLAATVAREILHPSF